MWLALAIAVVAICIITRLRTEGFEGAERERSPGMVRRGNTGYAPAVTPSPVLETEFAPPSDPVRNPVPSPAASDKTIVRGRLVQGGNPLANVAVTVALLHESKRSDAWAEFAATSQPDGTFAIELPIQAPRTAGFHTAGTDLPIRRAALGTIEPGTIRDLHDVEFPRCGTIQGLIRDALGQPVSGVTVLPKASGTAPQDALGGTWYVPFTESAEDGRYRLAGVIPGDWTLTLRAPGISATPGVAQVLPGSSVQLDFLATRLPRISGRATYPSGMAAKNVDVAGYAIGTWNRVTTNSITDEDGRFVLERPAASPFAPQDNDTGIEPAGIELRAIDRKHRSQPRTVNWGESEVALQVEDRPGIELVVLDDATSAPLAGFGCRIGDGRAIGQWEEVTIEDGHARVDVVSDSTVAFLTILAPETHRSRGALALAVAEGQVSTLTVRLEPAYFLDAKVVDDRGLPIANAEVKVVACRSEFDGEGILRAADARRPVLFATDPRQTYFFDARRSDNGGLVRLSLPQLEGFALWLVASADGFPVRGFRLAAHAGECVVTLTQGVDLLVEVRGAWPDNARLRVVTKASSPASGSIGAAEFEIATTPARSRIALPQGGRWECRFRSAAGGDFLLSALDLVGGGSATLELDAAAELWPQGAATISKQGAPVAEGVLRIAESVGPDSARLECPIREGRVELPALPRRSLWIWLDDEQAARRLDSSPAANGVLDFP